MKAIILSRVSMPEQKKSGLSLPAQNKRLERHIREHKLEKWKEFEFDETVYKSKRKDFSEIIKLLEKTKEPVALCCDKIDRLIRNFTMDLVRLEELRTAGKIELHFPSDNIVLHKDSPAADLFRWSIGIALAKYYSDAISDNVKRANEQKLRNGEWPGKAPCGYKNVSLNADKKWIEADPERADLVIKLFEWYATGRYSMELLRRKAKSEGLRNNSKKAGVLTKSQIDHILKNPFYYGEMRYKG
ncbi:MAG: recombinase family protein, partial [Candidatus Heimdallarchaeaceae archaeon]